MSFCRLNPQKDPLAIEKIEAKPLHQHHRDGVGDWLKRPGKADRAAEKVVRDLPKINALLGNVDQDRVCADHGEEERPGTKAQYVDDPVEESHQEKAPSRREKRVRA